MCFHWLTTELWRCMFIGQYIIPVIKLLLDVKETNVFFSLLLRSLVQYGRLLLQFKNCSPSICVENGHLFLSFFWIVTTDSGFLYIWSFTISYNHSLWCVDHPTSAHKSLTQPLSGIPQLWASPCFLLQAFHSHLVLCLLLTCVRGLFW